MEDNSKITTPVKISLDGMIEAGTPEWYEAVEKSGGLEKMQEQFSQSINKIVQPMKEMIQEATAPAAALFTVANMISEVLENVFADVKTELETLEREYQEYTADRIAAIKEKSGPAPWIRITELAESIPFWAGVLLDYFDYMEDLGEYLEQELEKPDYDGLTMSDMLKPFPDDFNNNLWTKATQAAEEAMKEADPERYQAMLDNRRRRQQDLGEDQEEAGKKPRPRNKAIEKGALMTIGGHIASYSADDLKDALNAYSIWRLPSTVDHKRAFDSTGKLDELMLQDQKLEGLTEIHTAFLMAVVQAVSLAQIDDGGNTITFYLPAICRELKIDPRTYSSKRRAGKDYADMRFHAVLEMIMPFDPLVGRTPDGSYYRVLTFESYDKNSDTMTISTPYLYRLKAIYEQREIEDPQLNRLLHSDVANEPNRAAVELANRILTGIVTRGTQIYKEEPKAAKKTITRTDKEGRRTTTTTVYDTGGQADDAPTPPQTVYRVKYQTLINDCPQFKRELDEITVGKGKAEREAEERGASEEEIKQAREKDRKTIPQRYNKKLKDVFTAAFRIIAEKSDAPARYLDFSLPTTTRKIKGKEIKIYDVPTKSTLSRNLIITHKGRNPHFTY